MKKTGILQLAAIMFGSSLCAAVPISWDVDVTRVAPVRLDAYHGETLELSASMLAGRVPLTVGAGSASFLWQTNGMGAAWWQTNATVSADGVVRGTFGPAMDTGADSVRFFFSVVSGAGANYRAAGTISLRPSPGASPTTADLAPQTVINFADYQLVNAPWITGEETAEAVRAATNALATVLKASDNALASALADASRAATNYADSVASAGDSALAAATNAVSEAGRTALVAAATSASNYTDAAVAAIDIPSLTGYATEAWVQGRGYLTDHQSLAGYATEEWTRRAITNALPVVPSLEGYATEAWVQGRGYLTEHQPLAGYATEAWVQGRGYLTGHQSLSGYATEDWTRQAISNALPVVPSLAGYATEAWVTNRGYLTSHQPLAGYATEAWVQGRNYLTEHQSLAGYATEAYATDAATGARDAAEAYARGLSWAASSGNTRLVTLDGTIWQDATGTVWQVSYIYGWSGTVIDLQTSAARPITFNYAGKLNTSPPTDYWSAGAGTNLYFGAGMASSWELWMDIGYHGVTNEYWQASGTPPPPSTATNLSFNTTFELYSLFYQPVALATNPVDHVIYSSDSVSRALTYGTPTRWTDATGCVWEVQTTRVCTNANEEWAYTMNGQTYTREQMIEAAGGTEEYSMILDWEDSTFINKDYDNEEFEGWYVLDGSGTAPVGYNFSTGLLPSYASDPYLAQVTYYGNITATRGDLVTVTNLVGRVALTNDIPAAPDLSPIQQDLADLRTESALVYRLYSGSNVVAEVTNYNSQVHAPELRLMQLNESNEYITVWTETNGLTRTLAKANEYTDAAITNRAAPRAWSKVTAGMGFEAPSNTTWLSTARTVIAGGLDFEKHVTSGGAIWLLESNGMTADFHAQTNNTAFIDLSNADGTPVFRVEKTDSFLVGVHVDRVSVDGDALVCGVNVVAADHPLVRVKADLPAADWAKEEDGIPASLATVTWSGTTGDWTCRIQNNTGGNTLFAQMEYFQEGGTKIVNSAAMDVSQGILCTDGIHKCRPVYSSAGGGTITWEVVQ